MVRYLLAAAGAIALMSTVATAQTHSTTVVTRSAPPVYANAGATQVVTRTTPYGRSKTIVKRKYDRYGRLITVKRTVRDGFYGGSSVSRSVTDPYTGTTRTVTRTR